MDTLLFGISGLPLGNGSSKFNYANGIDYSKLIGLDAMELLFVRSVNITDNNKGIILESKIRNNFYLSAYGSYYINLNAKESEKQEQYAIDCHVHKENGFTTDTHCVFSFISFKNDDFTNPVLSDNIGRKD